MNKKVALIKSNQSKLISTSLNVKNVEIFNMFIEQNAVFVFLRLLLLHCKIGLPRYFYNNNLINIDADIIIVTDGHLQTKFVKWLRKHNPNTRIIVWYWNTIEEVGKYIFPDELPESVEKWSYSKYDCKRYGLKYNTTYYPYPNEINIYDYVIDTDVYFLGKDKGRLGKLIEIQKMLEEKGLSTFFYICSTKKYQLKNNKIYRPQIPYKEVLIQIAKSRAIVDCFVSRTAGPTIRPMEALYYHKKLITDDCSIKFEDFYDKNNIFILGEDDLKNIFEFVRGPYKPLDQEILNKYTIESWIARFFED